MGAIVEPRSSAGHATSGLAPTDEPIGKQPLTGAAPAPPRPAPAAPPADGLGFEAMLAAVLAAQPLTERAVHGDTAALTQALKLLAPVEARLSQLNDHQGRLAAFGAGNVAGQAALDLAETAIRAWRQRLALGTVVRTDELVLRFRAGAEPIRFLTGEARAAPTLRAFDQVSRITGAAAAAPVLAPVLVALAVEEAPLLAFVARGAAQRVGLWALAHPAAALAAAEALLGFGVQIGESGWEAFWGQLADPHGRWLFLAQVLMDFMHVQSGMHPAPAEPDLGAARQRLGAIRALLAHVDDAALPPGGARKPTKARPSFGKAYPDNPFEHVRQREDYWCGAACGQMAASRLGVQIDQADLVGTPYFRQPTQGTNLGGGFQTDGLLTALEKVGQVPGRLWRGGQLPEDMSKPPLLLKHLKGYLESTQASIILRVKGGRHWIIVDSVTSDDRFVIRDPGELMSTVLTAEQLSAMFPTGDAVLSVPAPKERK
ncbi:MAG TPA: hypothetical protein VFP84_12895 [Kofleriaceae bacterium]|nr:hypothetical protein [Kofleriaceae bacterium]